MTSKWFPVWSHWAPKITKNPEERALKKTLKIGSKKCHILTSKMKYFFARKTSLKSLKIKDIVKMGLQVSKMSPRASKIIKKWTPGPPKSPKIMRIWWPKIKKSGHPKSRKSPPKKTSRIRGNKDTARWRVMRAAHWILKCRTKNIKTLKSYFIIL